MKNAKAVKSIGKTTLLAVGLATLLVAAPQGAAAQITNGVYVPGTAPFGKTYAQWSAAFWQWADSLAITYHPLYDTAPIDVGQSGPVWFFSGHWANNSIWTRTGNVPANSTAMMFMIEGTAADNSGCPPTAYPEGYLRSYLRSTMNQVHDLVCTIDGAAIQGLMPSYLVQSPAFTFVTPPDNNILVDREGESCYSNPDPGAPPWVIPGAVADGIYVILAPLAPGVHTIHFTAQVGTPVYMMEDMTYILTAVPVTLTTVQQGNTLMLSWPLVTTNYVLETATTLTSANWTPAGRDVQTLADHFEVAIPITGCNQFYRLRN